MPVNSSTNCLGGPLGDYGERLRQAKRDWEAAHDPEKLSWAAVARRAGVLLGRKVHPETARFWAAGKQEPTVAEFWALASVLETDLMQLTFGSPEDRPLLAQEPEAPRMSHRPTKPDAETDEEQA